MNKASPKTLLNRLQSVSSDAHNVDFQVFRGIYNDNEIPFRNEAHNNCFAITFLQMFFHCPDIINYLRNHHPKNSAENHIFKILNDLYKTNNNSAIRIEDFLLNWSGWETKNLLPHHQCDITEFANYFLSSLSDQLSNFFYFDGDFDNPEVAPFDRNYLFYVLPIGDNIQEMINISLNQNYKFTILPQYFIISVVRHGFHTFNEEKEINTFIKIDNVIFKFLSVAVFAGKDMKGHYKSFIKIKDEYFLFNDEEVTALFYYNRCSSGLKSFISGCNEEITKRNVLVLYEKYSGPYISNTFECITFNPPKGILPGSNPIQKMRNTLNQIKKDQDKKIRSSSTNHNESDNNKDSDNFLKEPKEKSRKSKAFSNSSKSYSASKSTTKAKSQITFEDKQITSDDSDSDSFLKEPKEKSRKSKDEFDDLFYYYYEGVRLKNSKHKLFNNPTLKNIQDYNPNDSLLDNTAFLDAIKDDIEYGRTYRYSIQRNKTTKEENTSYHYHLSGAIEWLGTKKDYNELYKENIDEYAFENDDNQFLISMYNWKERAEIFDVECLYQKIKTMSEEEKKNADKKNEDSFDKLVLELEQDIARRYVASHMKIVDFIPQYNYINSSNLTAPKCIKAYRTIKKIPYRKPIYSEK